MLNVMCNVSCINKHNINQLQGVIHPSPWSMTALGSVDWAQDGANMATLILQDPTRHLQLGRKYFIMYRWTECGIWKWISKDMVHKTIIFFYKLDSIPKVITLPHPNNFSGHLEVWNKNISFRFTPWWTLHLSQLASPMIKHFLYYLWVNFMECLQDVKCTEKGCNDDYYSSKNNNTRLDLKIDA